jgi:hypothetical protein
MRLKAFGPAMQRYVLAVAHCVRPAAKSRTRRAPVVRPERDRQIEMVLETMDEEVDP